MTVLLSVVKFFDEFLAIIFPLFHSHPVEKRKDWSSSMSLCLLGARSSVLVVELMKHETILRLFGVSFLRKIDLFRNFHTHGLLDIILAFCEKNGYDKSVMFSRRKKAQ
jgi:hypothetical protein